MAHRFITAKDMTPEQLARAKADSDLWVEKGFATGKWDTCQRCGHSFGEEMPNCPNFRQHGKQAA